MKKEEFKKLMEENFEELTRGEFNERNNTEDIYLSTGDFALFFKKKVNFPIIVKLIRGSARIYKDGEVSYFNQDGICILQITPDRINIHEGILKKAKEIRGNK